MEQFKNRVADQVHKDEHATTSQHPVAPRTPQRSRKDSLTRTLAVSKRKERPPPRLQKNDQNADRLSTVPVHRPFSFAEDEPFQVPYEVRVARFSPLPRGHPVEYAPESPPADLPLQQGRQDELFLAPRQPALQRRASSRLPSDEDYEPPAHLRLDNVRRGRAATQNAEGEAPRSVHIRWADTAAPGKSFAARMEVLDQRPEDRKLSRSRTHGHRESSR